MDRGILEKLYRQMVRIRAFEESLIEPISKGEIKTPCHLYTGQEAIAAGICSALPENSFVFGNHRSHGHYLAKGGDMKELMAEIFCKESGCSAGRGGSMHVIAKEKGFLGSVPIVAGTIPLAVGAAFAGNPTVSFFGEGATGEGVLYESMNMAAVRSLPVIFVCENNLYATHMPVKQIRPDVDIYKIAEPFGIKSWQIDGNDVLKVFETAKKAVSLNAPVFIECLTYRQRGHVGPDDNIQGFHTDIRPREEIKEWLAKDPILRLEKYLSENNIFASEDLDNIKKQAEDEVKEAKKFAKESDYPKEIEKYVFK